jgi:hypothetical protein
VLGLSLFSTNVFADLNYFNNVNYPISAVYAPNGNYQFNITWQNTTPIYLENVSFEWNWVNETPSGFVVKADNTTEFYVNKTDLPANESGWNYRWYANDTGNNYNSTNQQIYIIAKNTSGYLNLTLDGIENNRSYNRYDNANFTVYLNLTGKTVYLNSTYPSFSLQSNASSVLYNITNLSSLGIFSLIAYWDGDENYTSSSKTYFFDNTAPQYDSEVTNPPNSTTYNPGSIYQFNISWSDASIDTIIFRFYNKTGTGGGIIDNTTINPPHILVNNITRIYYVSLPDLPAGNYTYYWYANDSLGRINFTNDLTYVIIKADAIGPLTVFPGTSVTSGTQTTVTCPNYNENAGRNEVNETLKFETTEVLNPDVRTISSVGTWTYYCSAPDRGNYTNIQKQVTITVTQQTTGGSTGGDQGGGGTSSGFTITDLTSLSIEAGQSKSTTFNLKNTFANMKNVNITLSGIDSSWYSITPQTISLLKNNIPETVTITFNIPSTAEAKDYSITVTAKGAPLLESIKTVTKTMTLTVTSPPEQETAVVTTAITNATTQNVTSNVTAGPTGLVSIIEYLRGYTVLIIGIIACLMVFGFRNNITGTLKSYKGISKPSREKPKKPKPDYKLVIGLKKETPEVKEEIEEKKTEKVEREIKRDIKELKEILEAEKKLKGKRKLK